MQTKTHQSPELLEKAVEDIVLELREVEMYIVRHKRKLEIIQQFILHWERKKHWNNLKEELASIRNLDFLNLKKLDKEKRYSKETFQAITATKRVSPPTMKEYLSEIIKRMRVQNKILKKLRKNLLAQLDWLKENESEIWIQRDKIKPLLRLVKDESYLLYEHGLSGHKNERDILYEIYNMIMPLKERLLQWEKITKGGVSRKTKYQIMGQDPAIMKRVGAKKKQEWPEKGVRRRMEIMQQYYDYLHKRGVPLPNLNALYTISKMMKTNQGIKKSGYYTVAIKQKYGGLDGLEYFKKENNIETIIDIYTKMLIALNNATKGKKTLAWLYDFSPQNFAVTPTGAIVFIDIDPPGWNHPHYNFKRAYPKRVKEFGSAGSSNKRYFFRHATTNGQFMHLLEHSCGGRPDLKNMFVQTTLEFLKKTRRYDVLRFLKDYVKKTTFRTHIKQFASE